MATKLDYCACHRLGPAEAFAVAVSVCDYQPEQTRTLVQLSNCAKERWNFTGTVGRAGERNYQWKEYYYLISGLDSDETRISDILFFGYSKIRKC